MSGKKIFGWLMVIFIVYYLVTQPAQAAVTMHHVFGWLATAAGSLSTFVNGLGG